MKGITRTVNTGKRLSLLAFFAGIFSYSVKSQSEKPVQKTDSLATVTITSKKRLITRKSDRYIINVENSSLANGNTGLEVLQKSPGIWIDNNGSIRIRGNQAVTVMINDVVQRMSGIELSEYLKTLKSEDISSIEVIYNPPAEFEGSGTGGIIHIILKRPRQDGLNGSVNAQLRQQGDKPSITAGNTFNYKVKSFYLFGGYTFTKERRSIKEKTVIIYPDKSSYNNHTDRNEDVTNHQYRLGIAYDISPVQSVVVQTIITNNRFLQYFNTYQDIETGNQVTTGTALADKVRAFRYGSTTLNYSWKIDTIGSMLKIIADYTYSDKTEINNFLETYSDPIQNATYRNNTPFDNKVYGVQADYTKVLKNKAEIKGGVKYSSIKRDNIIVSEKYIANNWEIDPGNSNQFIYTENLLMFYSSIEKKINKNIIKAGLRAENTRSNGNSVTLQQQFHRQYFDFFPSLFITHILDEQKNTAVYINYSRRLSRPSLRDLNPFRLQFNNYTAMTGNPDLLPQYTHNFGVGYIFLRGCSADLYFTRTMNVITLSANTDNNNFIEYKSENVNSSSEYGLALNIPFPICKWWTTNNSFSVYHSSYMFNHEEFRQNSFSAKTINSITIRNIFDIETIADYRSPYTYSNIYNPYSFYFDLSLSKSVLKKKGRLRLSFSDIFNSLWEKEITDGKNTYIEFYRKRPTRSAGLSFTYNFSAGKNFNSRKIDQGNTEERNRSGN